MRSLTVATLLALTTLVACGDELVSTPPDAASTPDGGAVGGPDAGERLPDAGELTPDAGDDTPDAGEQTPDAGNDTPDAGNDTPDAGNGTPDAGPPPAPLTQFVVLGDQGEGNPSQYKVGAAIATKCAAEGGCDFGILLGDNFYDSGVDSVTDTQWQTKFELPYKDCDFPFYAVLGNHDYGGTIPFVGDYGGLGNEWDKGPTEVRYSIYSEKWRMPVEGDRTFYSFKEKNIGFVMLDTNSIFWDESRFGNQKQWYAGAVTALQPADWIFVAGHHPYKSNGKHGNAGAYEGIDLPSLGNWAFFDGRHVKNFYEGWVKGTADVLLAGHDHNRQWLARDAFMNAELIVSGAGAKTTADENRGNPTEFEDFTTPGFTFIRIEGRTMTGQMFDENGNLQFERVVRK